MRAVLVRRPGHPILTRAGTAAEEQARVAAVDSGTHKDSGGTLLFPDAARICTCFAG